MFVKYSICWFQTLQGFHALQEWNVVGIIHNQWLCTTSDLARHSLWNTSDPRELSSSYVLSFSSKSCKWRKVWTFQFLEISTWRYYYHCGSEAYISETHQCQKAYSSTFNTGERKGIFGQSGQDALLQFHHQMLHCHHHAIHQMTRRNRLQVTNQLTLGRLWKGYF